MTNRNLWILSGIAGIVSVLCYLLAITLPWPETQLGTSISLLVVCAWPILSILFCYGLYTFVALEREGTANRLAFVFATLAFTTVLSMIVVQLAVGAGFDEIANDLDTQYRDALWRGVRMIDIGLDVAWDMLIGTALLFLGVAIRRRSGFGIGWAIPCLILGAALILLNAATFPWPPGDSGLFDIGPFVGLFVLIVAVRLIVLGRREARF